MPRELLTLFLPLILPTVVYLVWLQTMRWSQASGGSLAWRSLPWMWLGLTGVALAAVVLFVVTVHFGTATPGVYVPPHVENGQIVPGHIEQPKP